MLASMGSSADIGDVRSRHTDRGARIRTFRKLKGAKDADPGGCAAVDGYQNPPADDTNGRQYTEVSTAVKTRGTVNRRPIMQSYAVRCVAARW